MTTSSDITLQCAVKLNHYSSNRLKHCLLASTNEYPQSVHRTSNSTEAKSKLPPHTVPISPFPSFSTPAPANTTSQTLTTTTPLFPSLSAIFRYLSIVQTRNTFPFQINNATKARMNVPIAEIVMTQF